MKKYFIYRNENQDGPFSKEELIELKIMPEDYIWYEGLTDWQFANTVEELKDIFIIENETVNDTNIVPDNSENNVQKENIIPETEKNLNENISNNSNQNISQETGPIDNYIFKTGQYISTGWEIFKSNALGFIGFNITIIAIIIAVNLIPVLGQIAAAVLQPILLAGFFVVSLKIIKNETYTFSDFFGAFNMSGQVILTNLIMGILIAVGMLLLLIPGIYLAVSYILSLPILIDKKTDFWTALETSRKTISKNWFSALGLIIIIFIINVIGVLLFGIGLFITMPLSQCILTAAYYDIFITEN